MSDNGYQTLEIYQLARSLAISIHSITLSPSGWPPEAASSLRRTSRRLIRSIVNAYHRRTDRSDFAQDLRESRDLCSEILGLLSSPQVSTFFPEKVRTELCSDYRRVCDLVEKITDSRQPDQISLSFSDPRDQRPRTLEGKVILITRPVEQSPGIVQAVERAGGLPVVVPMIEITDPSSWEPVDRSIADLEKYDGVIFTSQNAVERFIARIKVINPAAIRTLSTRRIYAAGDRTRAALEEAGIPVTLMPARFSARDMIFSLQSEAVGGKRFLFPKGNIAKEDIPEALRGRGAEIDEIVVYRTVGPSTLEFESLRYALKNGEIDVVTFFSPSSVRNFAQYFGADSIAGTVAACIGRSTAEEAELSRFPSVVTAKAPTVESLIETLIDHFER